MSWSIFQHWRDVGTSVWYHHIGANFARSATKQGGKQAAVSIHIACYHIGYDLRKVEKRKEIIRL